MFTQNLNKVVWVAILDLYSPFLFSHRQKSGKHFLTLYAAEELRNIKLSSDAHTAFSLCPC